MPASEPRESGAASAPKMFRLYWVSESFTGDWNDCEHREFVVVDDMVKDALDTLAGHALFLKHDEMLNALEAATAPWQRT